MYNGYSGYRQAAGLLPAALRQRALALDERETEEVEELRLRIGRPLALTTPAGERVLTRTQVSSADLEQVVDAATDYSPYTAAQSLRQGFLSAPGGLRIGVCGQMTGKGVWDLSSLSIRIPRACRGAALPLLPQLLESGRLCSTLILSPPGGGKTTLLRDLVRLASDGGADLPPLRVSLVDERGEVAAVHRGTPQLDVGRQTDVITGLPKARAIPILLRAMNPQVIALDEVALEEDISAILAAAGCGAALLATVHAPSPEALRRRTIGETLLAWGIFQRAVVISKDGSRRTYRVEVLT